MDMLNIFTLRLPGNIRSAMVATALLASILTPRIEAVMVKEVSVSPAQIVAVQIDNFYTGNVYAGIVNLQVDGIATQGFCIDPFHFSSKSTLPYDLIALADAPKNFSGGMDAIKADQISKLWGMAFSSSMNSSQAAAMQLAIWEIVAGDLFTIKSATDYGAAALVAQLGSYQGPKANLIALTGAGQDYVIATVPEAGATLILLGLGLCGLAAFRRIRS